MAATTPAHLWLASGVRAIDHYVEGLRSVKCHDEAASHFEKGLAQYHAGLEDSDGSNKDDKRGVVDRGLRSVSWGRERRCCCGLSDMVRTSFCNVVTNKIVFVQGSVAGVYHGMSPSISDSMLIVTLYTGVTV